VTELAGEAFPETDVSVREGREGEPSPEAKPPVQVQTQFTRGFGEWLIHHRVGLVCSTYQTGHLLFVGVRPNGAPVPSAAAFSCAMGIAAFSQRVYVGTRREIWRLENVLGTRELDSGTFDRLYIPRNAQVTGDIDIHELAVDPDGRILFANTRYSCLATISPTRAFKPLWKPKFISRLAPEDRCHLNGLAMENGRPRYVTACSTGDAVESWRGRLRDGGVVIDIENDAVVAEGLSMPHSPRVWNDVLYVFEAGRGWLVRVDRDTGKREDVTFCPGFARGLAFVSHYAVATISLPRATVFDHLPLAEGMRARGASPWCGLLIIDLRNGDIAHWLRMRGDVTELFDVGVIVGIRCPRGLGPDATELADAVRGEEVG
jgi:uncharacterized protein (TIGR03032 family)